MFALYEKHPTEDGYRYRFSERVHLFGCNNGYIPWLLSESLSEAVSEPLPWHLCIGDALGAVDQDDSALIINLKPNARAPNLSLYEVIEVFGYSTSGWTPVMLHLGDCLSTKIRRSSTRRTLSVCPGRSTIRSSR
jgi:hypothetical protein